MIVTPFAVVTTSPATVPATLPPCAAAMSTTAELGFIDATCSAVISFGAGRPGSTRW